MTAKAEVESLLDKARAGEPLREADLSILLDEQLPAALADAVLAAADYLTRQRTGGRGRIWAAIGLDAAPCSRSCRFCSLGARWGVYPRPYELSNEEVCRLAAAAGQAGADYLALRTTEDFPVAKLAEIGATVRRRIPPTLCLVANTGELEPPDIRTLAAAGFSAVYHVVRLREGRDTGIAPERRVRTLESVRGSSLKLTYLIEPLGPEHTDEEIAREAVRAREFGAVLVGAMARVPVPGTPLGELAAVCDGRLARAVAVSALAAGPHAAAVCVHPPCAEALRAGANTIVVDAGVIPRDVGLPDSAWRGFSVERAQEMLRSAGYQHYSPTGLHT